MRKTHRDMELREGHYIVLYIDFKQPKTFSRVFLGFRGESSEIVRKKNKLTLKDAHITRKQRAPYATRTILF